MDFAITPETARFWSFNGLNGPSITATDTIITRHIGVGTVTLRVKKRDSKRGSRDTSILILKDALYIPGSLCNLIGNNILHEYSFHLYDRRTGGRVAILDRPKIWRLRLTGQSATETILDVNGAYCFFTHWPISERDRWQELRSNDLKEHNDQPSQDFVVSSHHRVGRTGLVRASVNVKAGGTSYSNAEKEWVKEHYGGEYKFLRDYGFKIYNEQDRVDGRRLLQGLMEDEQDEKADTKLKFAKGPVKSVNTGGSDDKWGGDD